MTSTYPEADRWGRPLILLPDADELEPFTRVTTVAKCLDGQEALSEWKARMTAEGACLRPDILAQYAATLPSDPADKKQKALQNQLCENLKEAAQASAGANTGDARHTMFARVMRGEKFRPLPPHDVPIKAAVDCLARHEVEPMPEYVEQTVVLPEQKIAGSFDALVRKAGRLFVFDLKTAKDLSYSWLSISIQLALYSRATWIYDWDNRSCTPLPEVDQKIGLVLHLPSSNPEATLHVVDLETGWEAAQLALAVRRWRARRDLARPARS